MKQKPWLKVLVCGGRDFRGWKSLRDTLDEIALDHSVMVIQGGADGADALARAWAFSVGQPCVEVRAHWETMGAIAGPRRNGWMLGLGPDLVLAFPGGRGTENMVKQAVGQGVEVRRVGLEVSQ